MFDFSDDESFALLLSGVVTVLAAVRYYGALIRVTLFAGGGAIRLVLGLLPPVCFLLLLPVLLTLTSHEVKEDHGYVLLFLLSASAWLSIAVAVAALLGISLRDDAVERRNPAAAIALAGAMLGITAAYAGANIGEGATVWMTFAPALLAAIAWAAAWWLLEAIGHMGDAIAIDRDIPTAIRLALFLLFSGLMWGWAVAGDYQSAAKTIGDLVRRGCTVLPLLALTVMAQRYRYHPRTVEVH